MTTSSDFTGVRWRKASHSTDIGDCVEVAHTEAVFGVRDSKNTDGLMLALTARNGLAFLDAVKNDQLAQP
jgi:hypothetical protein